MSFVDPQRSSARYSAGIVVAVVFHIALIWALINGLGHKVMQVIDAPMETKIVEEIKQPPPPPKVIEMPPPPKFTPPPAFVPPPEVQVPETPPLQPTITATVAEPPPAPPAPIRVEAPTPAPAPAPAPVSAAVACSNYKTVMGDAGFPPAAQRLGLDSGSALIQFTLTTSGEIKDVKAVQASHPTFAQGAMKIVGQYKCTGQGRDVVVRVPFVFKSE
jgi:periplasmic protein TonB